MTENNKRKSFLLYNDMMDMFELLTLEERGILISAIFNYVTRGAAGEEMTPVLRMAFASIKNTLDRDGEAYAERCEKNTANGKKGGRPRKNQNPEEPNFLTEKTEWFFSKTQKPDSDNDSKSESDIDSDIDSDSEAAAAGSAERIGDTPCSAPAAERQNEQEKNKFFEEADAPSERAEAYTLQMRAEVRDEKHVNGKTADNRTKNTKYAGCYQSGTRTYSGAYPQKNARRVSQTAEELLKAEECDRWLAEKLNKCWDGG